jgi:maltooligosyltrehalose trehalohydrolase
MDRAPWGYHTHQERDVPEGQRYFFRPDRGPALPDPRSLWQPEGVFGPSAVVFADRFTWSDAGWQGVRQGDLVFYEIHVGTFTAEGTFGAIIPRLPDLVELGVTAVEIMPVGQFSGAWGWGYDGVFPFAVHDAYGGPRALHKLVDACHGLGLAIFLDVVYNHFGPEGNVLEQFGPYLTDRYKTPWGPAVNYDLAGCDAVREFVTDNVRMWLEEFHIDGLRLDAADMIFDMGARHILGAIKEAAEAAGRRRGWPAIVTAESDLDDPRLLYARERGGHGLDMQWMDDYHHAVHAFLTGERQSYYSEFGEASQLARILERPYLYHWEYSAFRDRHHGSPALGLTGERFVVSLQNHDQVGNRAGSERLNVLLASDAKQRLAASLLLLSPYVPLLFMGEEYGEQNPFPFFCSFRAPELVEAVRAGRNAQFADPDGRAQVPDPCSEATFTSAKLTWLWPEGTFASCIRRLYRDLLAARREWPALRDFENRTARLTAAAEGGFVLELVRGAAPEVRIRIIFNLGDAPAALPEQAGIGERILLSSESVAYAGARRGDDRVRSLLPWECVVLCEVNESPVTPRV